jgi:hypothetical protein
MNTLEEELLAHLRTGRLSYGQLRLYHLNWCLNRARSLPDPDWIAALYRIVAMEGGEADRDELMRIRVRAYHALRDGHLDDEADVLLSLIYALTSQRRASLQMAVYYRLRSVKLQDERLDRAVVEDLLAPQGDHAWHRWRAPVVRNLARDMEARRTYDALPILADALEEAGCDSVAILEHCREERRHFPGCWVLEGLLRGRVAELV